MTFVTIARNLGSSVHRTRQQRRLYIVHIEKLGLAWATAAVLVMCPSATRAQALEDAQSELIPPNSSPSSDVPFQLRLLAPLQILQPPRGTECLPPLGNMNTNRRKTLSGHAADSEDQVVEASSPRTMPNLDRASARAVHISRCANEPLVSNRVLSRTMPSGGAGSTATGRMPAAHGTQGSWRQASPAAVSPAAARPATSPGNGPSWMTVPGTSYRPASNAVTSQGSWGANGLSHAAWGNAARPATPASPQSMAPAWSSTPPGSRGTQVPSVSSQAMSVRAR